MVVGNVAVTIENIVAVWCVVVVDCCTVGFECTVVEFDYTADKNVFVALAELNDQKENQKEHQLTVLLLSRLELPG